MDEETYKRFYSYTARVKQYCPEVLSPFTKHPRGKKIFLAMMEALDNGTAGEEKSYYAEIVNMVIPLGYDNCMPKEEVFRMLAKADKAGEKLVTVPTRYHLPGSDGYFQCDGWSYNLELPSEMYKDRERIIQLTQAKYDALLEITELEQEEQTDERDRKIKRLHQYIDKADGWLRRFDHFHHPAKISQYF